MQGGSFAALQKASPFSLTGSPDNQDHALNRRVDGEHYFVRPGQTDSYRQLRAWVSDCDGMVLVTGRSGTGKTTLLNELMLDLQAADALLFFFPNPVYTADQLLDTCLEQLGLDAQPKAEFDHKLQTLSDTLQSLYAKRTTVLLADEAHALSDDVLSTLLNLAVPGTTGRSLLPVIIAGYPSLERRLSDTRFLPLARSIRYHYPLSPLDTNEVASFIQHHIHAAGGTPSNPFSAKAVERIAYYSGGLPSRIKQLSDMAAFIAALEFGSEQSIQEDAVEKAAHHLLIADKPQTPADVLNHLPTHSSEHFRQLNKPPNAGDATRGEVQTEQTGTPSFSLKPPTAAPDSVLDLGEGEQGNLKNASVEPSNGLMLLGASRRSGEAAAGKLIATPQATALGPRRTHLTAIVLGAMVIVLASGWLASSYPIRFQQLASRLSSAFWLADDRNNGMAGQRSGTVSNAEPVSSIDRRLSHNINPPPETASAESAGVQLAALSMTTASPDSPEARMEVAGQITDEHSSPDHEPLPKTAAPSSNYKSAPPTSPLLAPVRIPNISGAYSTNAGILEQETGIQVTERMPGSRWRRIQTQGGEQVVINGDISSALPLTGDTEKPASPSEQRVSRKDETGALPAEVDMLLAQAGTHVREDRLMAPRFDNALSVYRKILRAHPGNSDALAGIERIKAKLMEFARDAVAQGDLESARSQINKILLIDAEDSSARTALAHLGERDSPSDAARLEE